MSQPLRHSQRERVLLKNQPKWLVRFYRQLIRNRSSFHELHIFHELIDQRGAMLLSRGLEQNSNIDSVWLHNNGEFDVREGSSQEMMDGVFPSFLHEMTSIVQGIERSGIQLKKFMVFHNHLGVDGAMVVSRLLLNSQRLQLLDLTNVRLDGNAVSVLCQALIHNPHQTLRALKFDLNDVGIEGIEALTELLQETRSIQTLMLSRAHVDDFQAAVLFLGLEENFTLKRLLLHYNLFGGPSMSQFASLLKTNTTALRDVRLVRSSLGDEGAKAIAEGLAHNTSVKYLHLQECQIEQEGAVALAQSLRENSTLLELHLEDNDIQHEGATSFLTVLREKNMTLTHLSLDEDYKREAHQCRYYCQLNRFERKRLANPNFPWGLWPHVLVRVQTQTPMCDYFSIPNVRYGLLQSKPELFRRDHPALTSYDGLPLPRKSERKRKRRKVMDL